MLEDSATGAAVAVVFLIVRGLTGQKRVDPVSLLASKSCPSPELTLPRRACPTASD